MASRVEKPPIVWLPAHPDNVNVRNQNVRFEAIVWHTTAGGTTIEQLGLWFGGGNLRAGLSGSTHYGIGTDGRISQHVSLTARPIAHGAESGATSRLAQENNAVGASSNDWGIGIEILDGGVPGAMTDAQFASAAWLAAFLWQTEIEPHADFTGAVLDREHILGHYELAPVSKPICPSWPKERWGRMIDEIRSLLAQDKPVPDPRDAQIAALTAGKIGLRDAYTASVGSLDAMAGVGRTITAQAEQAARSARDAIQRFGA